MKTYPVLGTIMHDGKIYTPNSKIELDDATAAALPVGVLGEPEDAKPEAAKGDKPAK